MGRIQRVLVGIGVAFVAAPFLVWGFVILGFYLHDVKAQQRRAHSLLELRYEKAIAGAQEVKLLEDPEPWPGSAATGSAVFETTSPDPRKGVAAASQGERAMRMQALRLAEQECKSLNRTIASMCRVQGAKASGRRLVMELEFAQAAATPGRSDVIDELILDYTDSRPGDDATGRQTIYRKLATICQENQMTVGRCIVRSLRITTGFVDHDDSKPIVTRVRARILVRRGEVTAS